MNRERIQEVLNRLPGERVTVVGDFFLDQYWSIDTRIAEVSIETGLRANQVHAVRVAPGAAGTVVNNLAALGVGEIRVVGFTGDDGPGFELRKALDELGVDTSGLLSAPERLTPVYTKPMFGEAGAPEVEGERFDIKNRVPTSSKLEAALIAELERAAVGTGSILALDQVQEENCGVLTARVRERLCELGRSRTELPILADSRRRIGQFRDVMLKPNLEEARSLFPQAPEISELLGQLQRRAGRTVFLTRGPEGIYVAAGNRIEKVDAIPVSQPIDTVGAGDTVSAALGSAFAAGAGPVEAAQLAVLAASVTVRKIGMTGTATPLEILSTAG